MRSVARRGSRLPSPLSGLARCRLARQAALRDVGTLARWRGQRRRRPDVEREQRRQRSSSGGFGEERRRQPDGGWRRLSGSPREAVTVTTTVYAHTPTTRSILVDPATKMVTTVGPFV